ncbi:MerR family DNA-binding transcriptional regulator, partial [Enterococcus faecalis]|uniref:MerR family DNA-binding transcriptional regulator n=1 Tax=Enterococcus faecalis TaxID=1351 RepID=UPI00403F3A1C
MPLGRRVGGRNMMTPCSGYRLALASVAATDSSGIFMTTSGTIPIGELSRQTGCNIETIRYYERIRLLPL